MAFRTLMVGAAVLGAFPSLAEIEIEQAGPRPNRGGGIVVPAPQNAGRTNGARPISDVLIFRNLDQLHGSLLTAQPEKTIRWNHPDAANVIEFAPKNVIQIRLATTPPADVPLQPAVVRLTNEDELRGTIVSMSGGKLVLDTWYAGQLAIQQTMVASIIPKAGSSTAIYTGPQEDADWKGPRGEQGWRFKDGAFYATGSGAIGRNLKLPDKARIEFDLAWRQYPYLQMAIYTDNLDQVYGNCYMLQVSGNSVYLQRGQNRSFNNLGGGTNVETLQQRSESHFALLVDKTKKSIALFIDGEMIKQWNDPGEFAGTGGGIVFQAQGQGPVRLSNIVVAEWDGEFPSNNVSVAKDADIIHFINNDKVSGQLKSITNKTIVFETAFATLEIPLDRATQIDFASAKAERARRQANDITALFHNGGHVTFELEKVDERTVVGRSENFGDLTFMRHAFQEIRFHIYDESIKLTQDDEWSF